MDLERLREVERYGKSGQGRKELIKYLKGGRLTPKEAILAKCYECNGYYADGRVTCHIDNCPLWPFMPYVERPKRELSEERKAILKASIKNARESRLK